MTYCPSFTTEGFLFIHSYFLYHVLHVFQVLHVRQVLYILIGMVNKEAEMSDEQYEYYQDQAYEAEQRFQDWYDREVDAEMEPWE